MSKSNSLSVVLATYNEAENIERCLKAVKDLADEIIVVDGESTDDTVKIAKKCGAKVIKTSNKPIFHINKQMAIDEAKGDWILQLDADEVVSDKLKSEISRVLTMTNDELDQRIIDPKKKILFDRHKKILEKRDGKFGIKEDKIAAFLIPRINVFIGRHMMNGGVYPDGVIRLMRNGKAKFPCKSVHEQIEVSGSVSWLESDLIHYDSPTFSKYITRANRYTSLTAEKMRSEKVLLSFVNDVKYIFWKPMITFLSLFFRHRGYKDKFPGFVFALFSGLHYTLAYMKLGDLYRNESSN